MLFEGRIRRACFILLCTCYAAAQCAFFLHNIEINPQYDNQVIWYALDLNTAVGTPQFVDYLFQMRKYPLLYTIPFTIGNEIGSIFLGTLTIIDIRYIDRFVSVLYALGTFLILRKLSLKLFGNHSAVILLLTSIIFLVFSSAIRPHVPVAFWMTMTAYTSVLLREKKTFRHIVLAFGSAFAAFCTLQDGALAFILPLWAYTYGRWRQPLILTKAAILTGITGILAIACGYTFVLGGLVGKSQDFALGLGHDTGISFDWMHGGFNAQHLIGSEVFVVIFAILGIFGLRKYRGTWTPDLIGMLLVVCAHLGLFFFHPITDTRFFITILPLLAVLGAGALSRSRTAVQMSVMVVAILVSAKLCYLGLVPDTLQQASDDLRSRQGLVTALVIPNYFLNLPDNRFAEKTEDITYIVLPDYSKQRLRDEWVRCNEYRTSRTSNDSMFLWVETPWALFHVFEARSLGANLGLYCRSLEAQMQKL